MPKRVGVAGRRLTAPDGAVSTEGRTFTTMTDDRLALADGRAAPPVRHGARERTGVSGKPVYHLRAEQVHRRLVTAQHVTAVPGRTTDVQDAAGLAAGLRHGRLRALTRSRPPRVRPRVAEVNRLQKTLAGGHLKLAAVASDGLGTSGRARLAALLGGAAAPAVRADPARGRLRDTIPQVQRALVGRMAAQQRLLLAEQVAPIAALAARIARVSAEIGERLGPFAAALTRLDGIPGVGRVTAAALLAELGTDRGRFPTAGRLASWAGLCPGPDESGGKRRSGKTRTGSPWLRGLLVEAAHAAARTPDSYLAARYRRLAARPGPKHAAVAVAQTLLVIV